MATEQRFKDNHMQALKSIGFTGSFRTLRSLERIANHNAERACNDGDFTEAQHDAADKWVSVRVAKLFGGTLPKGFFINHDPRGAALKLDNETVTIPDGMHKDWGGYGILAPDWN